MKRQEIHAVIRVFAKEYKKAGRKRKTILLTQLEQTTGYYRKSLIELLSNPPKPRRKIRRVRVSRYIKLVAK